MVQGQHLGVRYSKKKMQGQEVLALTKWNTTRTMFNRKLLSLAHNSYYDQSPAALQSLFTKSSAVYNFRRKMIFSLAKPRSDILKKSSSPYTIAQELLTVYLVLTNLCREANFRELI